MLIILAHFNNMQPALRILLCGWQRDEEIIFFRFTKTHFFGIRQIRIFYEIYGY